MQLIGSDDFRSLDLKLAQEEGVRLLDRIEDCDGNKACFDGDLDARIQKSDVKMRRVLDQVDDFIASNWRYLETLELPDRPEAFDAPSSPDRLDLKKEGISTVIWATGFQRSYPWLRVEVLDTRGEIVHDGGVTPVHGLYAIGLNFMRHRYSSFIGGVGADAAFLADRILAKDRQTANAVVFTGNRAF